MQQITPLQEQSIIQAHAANLNSQQIAAQTGLSLSTVKRYRAKFGLGANTPSQQLARLGLNHVAQTAAGQGLTVQWPPPGSQHDLVIAGRRVDVKTARPVKRTSQAGGSSRWQFWLKSSRRVVMPVYDYATDRNRDADVVIFVCVSKTLVTPVTYIFPATEVPKTLTFGPHQVHDHRRDRWTLFT